eukprot:5718063-Prorocentrum_lima.AAC.1
MGNGMHLAAVGRVMLFILGHAVRREDIIHYPLSRPNLNSGDSGTEHEEGRSIGENLSLIHISEPTRLDVI